MHAKVYIVRASLVTRGSLQCVAVPVQFQGRHDYVVENRKEALYLKFIIRFITQIRLVIGHVSVVVVGITYCLTMDFTEIHRHLYLDMNCSAATTVIFSQKMTIWVY